jgi:hypothetical protein
MAWPQKFNGHLRHTASGYGLRGDHAITTFAFRAVKPLIGDTQKGVERISIAPKLRHPDADGDLDRRGNSDIECIARDGRTKTLANRRKPDRRMAVTVEIKTGKRRLIEYLMSPLLRYRQESLRER